LAWYGLWQDWITFGVLYREATLLITKSPPVEQALDELHRGYLWTQLGKPDKAEALFEQAVKTRPDDIEVRLARSRLFAHLAMPDRADADAVEVTRMQPKNPHAWIGYSRILREKGKHKEADAALAKASELGQPLHTFLEGGWWLAGPFPTAIMRLSAAPEKEADPSKPTQVPGKAPLPWRFVPAREDGFVDLRAVYDGDNISVYALNYVCTPTARTASLLVDSDDWNRIWVNGELIHDVGAGHIYGRFERVPISLAAGRNTLLVKVNNTVGAHHFTVRVADNPFDQARTFAGLGLWKETAELWPRHKQIPHDALEAFRFAYACLRAKDITGYREICEHLMERARGQDDPNPRHWAARASILASGAVGRRLAPTALAHNTYNQLPSHGGIQFARAAARFRDNRPGDAIDSCNGATNLKNDPLLWLLLSLAYHAKGDLPKAKEWRDKAEDWFAKQPSVPTPVTRDGALEDWLTAQVLRQELAERVGEKIDDVEGKNEQVRRAEYQKLDPATRDYDLALLLQPDEPRLLLARSRRLAELKRNKAAEADLAQYLALKPNDALFWRQQAAHHAEVGDWKLAAECYAKAGPKAAWDAGGYLLEQASICLLTGDEPGYRRLCQEMLGYWEPTNKGRKPGQPELARAITLADNPADEVDKALNLFAPHRWQEEHWVLTRSGALRYRAGKYKEATMPLQRCLDKYPNWPGRVVNYLWLALAAHKAGEKKEAESWLDKADKWFAQYPTGMPQVGGPALHDGINLHDWLEAHILRREAERLIRR
jgi:tetratricopeptide (TPR) repeat protein